MRTATTYQGLRLMTSGYRMLHIVYWRLFKVAKSLVARIHWFIPKPSSSSTQPTPGTPIKLFIDPKVFATGTSVFANPDFLAKAKQPIEIVDRFTEADIIVVNKTADLLYYTKKAASTPIYLSTFEPYDSFVREKSYRLGPSPIYVSNCYNGEGLPHNLLMIHPYFPEIAAQLETATAKHIESKWNKKKTILSCMRCNLLELKNPENRLAQQREDIALYGIAKGNLDLYGNDWIVGSLKEEKSKPLEQMLTHLNVIIENPESNGLAERLLSRISMLRESYLYNLCMENSDIPNYVTEKIWPAIYGYTLPLYFGNDSIYTIFPKDSFIDVRDFSTPQALFTFLENLSQEEYLDRLNRCISVVKNLEQTLLDNPNSGPSAEDIALDRIYSIYDKHYSNEN